ncbi:threonine-phosphate decarboxylase CobD [Sulfoacidibacillus thermotolerans]|uniref:threonine-phosphate decarboxylase n=1 Tax=Sulfoacidibacillus thermotolerans TaxID=1765684 RepID=A0A2U3DB81_SULT2|nr:threonine-phosphate decarboxylase CobD [Sulfoacidibacillus thermotolerans]PWI58533.1 threonine-phosphate decarboxylase [Sulfoacidibacillus thermotolerans]
MEIGVMHGGRLEDYEQAAKRPRDELADFSANINPLAPPKSVVDAIAMSIKRVQDYPDPLSRRLRRAFSERYAVSVKSVFAANGASEVIDLFLRIVRPRRVLILEPAFSEYAHAAKRNGIETVSVPLLPDFSLPREMIERTLEKGDVMILTTPHNPSGRFYSREEMSFIYDAISSEQAYAIVDEAFIDFVENGEARSSLTLPRVNSRVMIVRSLTKMYGIAGLRLGFGIASEERVAEILRMRDGWSVNVVAEAAGVAALRDGEFAEQTRNWLRMERAYCMERLQQMPGLRAHPSEANFLLVDGSAVELDVAKWQERLTQHGLFVRECTSYGTFDKGVFRMAILQRDKNKRLLDALAQELERN